MGDQPAAAFRFDGENGLISITTVRHLSYYRNSQPESHRCWKSG